MQEIGDLAMAHGWESYIAYSRGRDGVPECTSQLMPVGNKRSVAWHGLMTRLMDRHGLASSQATRAFIREVDALRPDVIHIHNLHGYFLNYRLLFDYLSHQEVPVIWTVHDCWLYTGHCYYYSARGCSGWQTGCGHCPQQREFPASWIVDRSHRNYIDKQRAFTSLPRERFMLIPVSHWMEGEMRHSFLKDCCMRVIHNGIDTETFSPQQGSEILDQYSLRGKQVLLGVASIWSREKGLEDFIRMADMLHEDERIVLVGIDEKTARKLPPKVIPIRRTANVHQLAQLYSAATAFVNPTWQDNYPTVNLEAISCGTPVVTYRTGGSPESITDATGIVVPQGNIGDMLAAVRQIEARGKDAFATPCRDYALAHFRKEDRYMDYIRLYDEVMQV